jgi:3-hydroxyisobutyrate dehydrogenase-like beta-hydroxyacid dehydrogenase
MKQNIGFIGLGNLGTPIALNLIDSGHTLHVYNRTASKAAPLAARGAVVCDTIASLAQQCDVVFTIVSDDAALKNVCEGEGGLLNHLQKESVHISMSTILPQTAAEISLLHKQHAQHYLASPVFGRPEAAAGKKLNFTISGDERIREQMKPLLKDAGGLHVWDFGNTISAANTVKLCGNFLIASALEAIGESVHLAVKSGVDAEQMWNMLSQTLLSAPVYINYSNIILKEKFEPAGFSMKLGLKDMNLVLQQAASVNQPMPLASLLKKNMQQLISNGNENIDWSAVSTGATGA